MLTGLPAALLRGTPSAIRDDRFTRCPFPAATTHAPAALARSSNTAMEHRNRCTDLRHPLATCCPCSSAASLLCNARPEPKSWTTAAFAQFQFFDPTGDIKPPFIWDEDRRRHLRAKLDALYFILYGIYDAADAVNSRDDINYIFSS